MCPIIFPMNASSFPGSTFTAPSTSLPNTGLSPNTVQSNISSNGDGFAEGHGGPRGVAVLRPFLGPVAHLPLDHSRVDPVAPRWQHLLAHLPQQLRPPA